MENIKGKFALIYIEKGNVYPAYPKDAEGRKMVDNLVKMGMFGQGIAIDKKQLIGVIKDDKNDKH